MFLVCYSVISRSSFVNIRTKWFPEISHHCILSLLIAPLSRTTAPRALDQQGPVTPFILVGTKDDLRADEETLQRLKQRNEALVTKVWIDFDEKTALDHLS